MLQNDPKMIPKQIQDDPKMISSPMKRIATYRSPYEDNCLIIENDVFVREAHLKKYDLQ